MGDGIILPVTVDGNKIYIQLPEQDKMQIFAENETNFFFEKLDGTIEFIKEKGKITGIIVNLGGKHEGKKVE